jgi:Protein of unknown function (DUF4238)
VDQLRVNNHFVPECYLKRWGNSEGKVFVYRTLVEHENVRVWKPHSVSAIAYQKHLYTQIISGHESDEVESWFAREFESPANEVLAKATTASRLTSDDWEILIKFLAAQDVRTPAKLLEHLQRTPKVLSEVIENVLGELKGKLDRREVDELKTHAETPSTESLPLKVTTHFEEGSDTGILKAETYVGRSTWIHSIKHSLENTRKVLHTHKWSIVMPAEGYYWPTSDNPVVKLNYYSPGNYDLEGGWGRKRGNIFFPIGPEHAMFVQIGDKQVQKNTRLSETQTREFLKVIVENSHRKIFSHFENMDIPLLKKRVVDPSKLSIENEEMSVWHQKNIQMEHEYLASNREF